MNVYAQTLTSRRSHPVSNTSLIPIYTKDNKCSRLSKKFIHPLQMPELQKPKNTNAITVERPKISRCECKF